jgi:plastocyanin
MSSGPSDSRPPGRTGAGSRARRLSTLAVLVLAGVLTAGCSVKGSNSGNADVIVGKQAFVAKCGSCHTLARAETKGLVGPDLDEAFRSAVDEGLQRSAIRGVVEDQVNFPNKDGVMPKNLASGQTLRDIAAYVSEVAAAPGKDTGLLASAVAAPGSGKPAVEAAGKLKIEANPAGQLAYVSSKATAESGAVTIEMPNMSGVSHNIAIEEGSHGATAVGTAIGASSFVSKGTATLKVTLKPGTYTYFCEAPGHRAAGMWGTLTVK